MPHGNQLSHSEKLKKIQWYVDLYSADATGDLNDLCISIYAVLDDKDTRPIPPEEPIEDPQ